MTDRTFSKPLALCMALFVATLLMVPLTGVASANHPSDSCLDVQHGDQRDATTDDPEATEDEVDENQVGSNHTLTAILRDYIPAAGLPDTSCNEAGESANRKQVSSLSGVNIDFEITGANDPDDSNSPETPDLTCTILVNQSSCTVEYQGLVTGTDTIRGWIDHDGQDASQGGATEADMAEGQNETTAPGTGCPGLGTGGTTSPPEPDCTDVVTKQWQAGPPAALDCDDQNGPDTERETNPSQAGASSNETYTCTVTDADGNPTDNRDVTVFGEVENPVNDPDPEGAEGPSYTTPDYRCQTNDGTSSTSDDDGVCTITIGQVDGEVGTAEICFWIEENEGDTQSDPQPSYTFPAEDDQGNYPAGEAPNEGGDAEHCGGESTGEAQMADGSDVGNDEADQVEKTWEARRASAVDAEPESDTNQPGENHTITAYVYDQFGSPFSGSTTVKFEFFQGSPSDNDGNTPSSPDRSCTTQNNSSCSITYTSQQPGLDRVCVFIGQDPNMQGDNTNGTCDGESLIQEGDTAGEADAPGGNDDQDVVQKRWGAAGEATRLDCEPETATNPTGTSHTVNCTARDSQGNPVQNANVDAEATGANDPDNGDSPGSPDFTCTTNAEGRCSFTHGPGGQGTSSQTGQTTYRAWIDSDNDNATTNEADTTEGQNETNQPGSEAEGSGGDNTDVVTKTWTGDARRIDCEPETATNGTGTTHTVTCTVTDAQGERVQGEGVTFTEEGPGEISGSSTDTTDQNGQATVTTTSNEAGEQTITGTLTDDTGANEPNEVDECDRLANDPQQGAPAGECSDSVTKTWTQPPPPECSDDADNDGDDLIDENDPGCRDANGNYDPNDNDETDPGPGPGPTRGPCQGFPFNSRTPKADGDGMIIVGSNDNDILIGTDGDDTICALGGDDQVDAQGGQDQVAGNAGADEIDGGRGKDQLKGGRGRDIVSGRGGNDTIAGGAGNDTLKGNKGIDSARGEDGNDILQGGSHQDTLVGGTGADTLRGWTGDDVLKGGGGHDIINGHRGFDICRGGRGNNVIRNCER